jgi:uncharacterized protein involved in outer membrane biogenesis
MRTRSLRFWVLLAAIAALVLGWSWLLVSDFRMAGPHIERWVTKKTGRELTIAGGFSLDLGSTMIVSVRNVRFANADWAEREALLELGHAEIHVALGSLLNPPILIEQAFVDDVRINLEEREDGSTSWTLGGTADETSGADEDSGDAPLLLLNGFLQNLELEYRTPTRTKPVSLVVNSLRQSKDAEENLALTAKGRLGESSISVEGMVGTWNALLAGEGVVYDLKTRIDEISIESAGTIDSLTAPTRPALNFSASGPDINTLLEALSLEPSGSGDISLEGSLAETPDGDMGLDVTGNVGRMTVAATARFASLDDFSRIDADLEASGPDLKRVLAIVGIDRIQSAPFDIEADILRDGPKLDITNSTLRYADTTASLAASLPEFPAVDNGNIEVTIEGPDLAQLRDLVGLPGVAKGPFSGNFTLAVDAEQRERFELVVETTQARLNSRGEARGGDSFVGTTANVELDIHDLAATLDAWQIDIGDPPAAAARAVGTVRYTGDGFELPTPLALRYAGLEVDVDGVVAFGANSFDGSRLAVGVRGEDLRHVTGIFTATEFVPDKPFALTSRLAVANGNFSLSDLDGKVGDASLTGSARIVPAPGIAGSRIDFRIEGDDFTEFVSHLPALEVVAGPYALAGGIDFAAKELGLKAITLTRPGARVAATVDIGLAADQRSLRFDITGNGSDINNLLRHTGAIELNPLPFGLDIEGSSVDRALEFDALELIIGDARIAASGGLDLAEGAQRSDLRITVDVPDIGTLGAIGGRRLRSQPLNVSASVRSEDGGLDIGDLSWRTAESDIAGSIRYVPGSKPRLDVDLESSTIVFAPFRDPPEEPDYDPEPEFEDGRLIPNVELPLEFIRGHEGSVRLAIGRFVYNGATLRDVALEANLVDSRLSVDRFELLAPSGALTAKAALDARADSSEAALQAVARDLAFGMTEANRDLAMTHDLDVGLEATGNNLRALAATVNGILFLDITGGRIANSGWVRAIYGNLLDETLSTINPFAKSDPFTALECVVVPGEFTNGKVTGQPGSFIRTDKVNFSLKSSINLETERIDIGIRTTPRRMLSISAAELVNPYVKVVGKLAAPTLAVDEKGVLITGGAAVATGGLSLIAKAAFDRLLNSGDPCTTARDNAVEALGDRFPDLEPPQAVPLP